jgi:hypothetical protein
MATQSKAVKSFAFTMNRATALVELFVDHSGADTANARFNNSDIVRGAIVLAVASMDAYFTRRFVEILVPYIKEHGPTQGLIDLLGRAGLNTEQALLMATMDRPFRRIRTLVDTHLSGYTTQRFHAIDELFLCFGIKDLCKNAQAKCKKKTTLGKIERLVLRRNQIVHDGDLNKHGKLQPVRPKDVVAQFKSLARFLTEADSILVNVARRKKAGS